MGTTTAARLTALRRQHGLSQEELAERLGVSRQAVSNWERSESLPDTGNLLGLSQLYRVTVDEVIGSAATAAPEAAEVPEAAAAARPATIRRPGVELLRRLAGTSVCAALSLVYFALLALPLSRSTVGDVAEVFSLPVGPALATTWFVAEVVFVLLPFVVIAAVPVPLPRWAWVAPLGAFAVPAALVAAPSLLGGASVLDYAGIGGALMPSIALKADVLALFAGCVLVHAVRRTAGTTRRDA